MFEFELDFCDFVLLILRCRGISLEIYNICGVNDGLMEAYLAMFAMFEDKLIPKFLWRIKNGTFYKQNLWTWPNCYHVTTSSDL
jgi:hypothetical protein